MKKVLIVTYIDFWRKGAGHRTRLSSIVNFLQNKVQLSILYIGTINEIDEQIFSINFPNIKFDFLEKNRQLNIEQYTNKFSIYIKDKSFEFAILEYIEMHLILDYFPKSTITILDTHDILSDKIDTYEKNNILYDGLKITYKEEICIFKKFDYVILINKSDYEKVSKEISNKKLMLIEHPITIKRSKVKTNVNSIVYVASEYLPNIIAIEWFIDSVWPYIVKPDLCLNIYGNVVKKISPRSLESFNINLRGFEPFLDDIYKNADIIINPVKFGAGLKIKNVEALGYGKPLITTKHGASGIEDGIDNAFLVAETSNEFIDILNKVINNYALRNKLSNGAILYANRNFSEGTCYKPLLELFKT